MEQLKRRTFKKRPARARLYGPAAFLALCLAIVFAMSIFFRVSRIEVRGNAYYTADEIVLASGVEEGDNLFFINQFSVMSRIFSRLPYVDTASVTRYLPNRVIITVTESEAMAAIGQEGQYWVIDSGGKILMQGTGGGRRGADIGPRADAREPHRGRDARHRQRRRRQGRISHRDT